MIIAVTGSRGFIGSAVVREARDAGHEVVHADRVDGIDITDPIALRRIGDVEHVIHLAGVLGTAELFDTPRLAVDVNVHGALNVLELCRRTGAGYTGITMPDVFPSLYAATKGCADRIASAYHLAHGLPVSRVRAFNAYGPGQAHGPGHPQKILPTFATEAWAGRPIPVWGDGTQGVDLVHTDDLARMLVEAVNFGDDEVFDGGTGFALTVNEVAEFVLRHTGSTAGIQYLPMRKGETPTGIVAEGDGWDLLDWKPELDWTRVADTIDWYKQ